MQKRFITLTVMMGMGITAVLWLTLNLQAVFGAPEAETGWETAVLYNGSLGTTPDAQGFFFQEFPAGATQTISSGGVILDTTALIGLSAGYFNEPAQTPVMNRTTGYTVTFAAQMLAETHNNANRAGFSLIALSSDAKGLELGFWENEIWAQADDSLDPNDMFTHAEGVAFDTTAEMVTYTLQIITDTYSLSANGAPILTGPIRDYTNFTGPVDPYETPNFIFLGDDTSSAMGQTKIDYAAVTVVTAVPIVVPEISFSSSAYAVSEGAGTAVISITLNVSTTVPVTVSYATVGQTALPGVDFLTSTGTLSFPPLSTAVQTFTVPIVDNVSVTPDKTVRLELSDPLGATLGLQTAVLTITNNDMYDKFVYLPVGMR